MILLFITLALICAFAPLACLCHRYIGRIAEGSDTPEAIRKLRLCAAGMGVAVLLIWMLSFMSVGQINGNPHESWLATQEAQERELLGRILGAKSWETAPSYVGSAPWAAEGAWRNALIRQRMHRD